jgi:hypothetical protein
LWIAQAVALLAIGFAIAAEPQKFRQQLDDLF